MGGQVIEERLPEDSLERRFATADGFVKLSERAPKKRCRQKQSCSALRLRMIAAKQFRDRRVAETTVACRREHLHTAQCAQQTFESGWVRAALGGEFSDRFRAAGKQVGNPQFRCGMNRLSDNNAGPDIFHRVGRRGSHKEFCAASIASDAWKRQRTRTGKTSTPHSARAK